MQSTNQSKTKWKFFVMSEYKLQTMIWYWIFVVFREQFVYRFVEESSMVKVMIFVSSAHFYLIVIFPIKIFLYISEPNLTLKFPSRFLLSLHCLISSRQIFGNLICNAHCYFIQTDLEPVLFVYTTPSKQFKCNIA